MTQALERREAMQARAEAVKRLSDVRLPRLSSWNYDGVCAPHRAQGCTEPVRDCTYQQCGGDLFSAQRVGVTWLYLRGDGLLADDPGFGKTIMSLFLTCLLKSRGELTKRALFVVQTPSLGQWIDQIPRWAPGLAFEYVTGRMSKAERYRRYCGNWDLLVVGHHVARRDVEQISVIGPFDLFLSDDVDELLSSSNVTHKAIVQLSRLSERSIVCNATTLQTKLEQLIAASMACGGKRVFGSPWQAEKRYVMREQVPVRVQGGITRKVFQTTGYKNLNDFRARINPMYLRRRLEELGVEVPQLMPPNNVYLDLSARQKELYDQLRAGVLKLKKNDGTTYTAVKNSFMQGQRICAGLPALGEPDGPGASPKLDWLFERMQGVWADRKIVAYVINRGMVEATARRAHQLGIGWSVIWGGQEQAVRERHKQRFMREENCRIMIGNASLERSHNLQVASIVVAIDTQLNPARMRQLLGRIRRAGSAHDRVQMWTLLMNDTQESAYLEVLRRRAGLSDYVFDEEAGAEMYGKLSQFELMEMILR